MPIEPIRAVRHAISQFIGQSSASNRDSTPPGKGELVFNFFADNQILKKIPGSVLYINSQITGDSVRFIQIFQYRWIYQIGSTLLIETAESSQVEQILLSGLDKARIFSDEWQGKIYLLNGTFLKYFDGSVVGDLGILPPGNGGVPRRTISIIPNGPNPDGFGFTAFPVGGPGQIVAGSYDYTFTYFDPLTNTESLPFGSLVSGDGLFNSVIFDAVTVPSTNPTGWIFFTVTTGVTGAITLKISPEKLQALFGDRPSRATQLNLYRRDPSTSSFKLVATFDLSKTLLIDFVDNALVSQLGVTLIPDLLTPPPSQTGIIAAGVGGSIGPRYIRFWRDSLWIFGASFPQYTVTDTTKNVSQLNIASSSVLYASDTSLPDYYPFNYYAGRSDGQLATGVAVAYDTLLAFKQRSIYYILGTSLNDFVLKILDPVRGCIAPGSLQETPAGVIFLSEDGVCICNAQGPAVRISQEIDDEIKRINFSAINSICSSYDRFKSKYRMDFPMGTSTANTRYIEFNLINQTWVVGSAYNPTASRYGIQSNLSSKLMVGKIGGRIIECSNRSQPNDDGQTIASIFRSADFDFGDRGKRKRLHWLTISAACSTGFQVDIRIVADYGQGPVFALTGVDANSFWAEYSSGASDPSGSLYDHGANTTLYVGPQVFKRVKIPIQGVGRTFYIEITERQNNTHNVMFDLHSIEVYGEILDK